MKTNDKNTRALKITSRFCCSITAGFISCKSYSIFEASITLAQNHQDSILGVNFSSIF